jgi:putative endonuclease
VTICTFTFFILIFFTYIARCADKSLYTGYCANLTDRENTHNLGKGAKYTRGRLPLKIIYSEEFETKSQAMKREAQIKKLKRLDKEKLIKG